MKRILIISAAILVSALIILGYFWFFNKAMFSFNFNSVPDLSNVPETPAVSAVPPESERFGFLRNVFDLDQERIEDTGAAWLRPNFGYFVWGEMQADASSAIDFSQTDQVVAAAQKHGLHLEITLFPFADWDQQNAPHAAACRVAANDQSLPGEKEGIKIPGLPYYRCNPQNWSAYEKWLAAVVARYDFDGDDDMPGLQYPVRYYEIGNEPELTRGAKDDFGTVFYLDTPENYADLLRHSYSAIKSADTKAQVLIAGAAGIQPEFQKFWQRVFAVPGVADYFDIANVHCISAPNAGGNDPITLAANDLNVAAYQKLLAGFGITKLIWVTEAENIQGNNVEENAERLDTSVANAIKDGADKIFFTGSSLANDPMKYTSEILLKEKKYYQNIIQKYQ